MRWMVRVNGHQSTKRVAYGIPEECKHGVTKLVKVGVAAIKAASGAKDIHAKYRIHKHQQHQQRANVEDGRQGADECVEHGAQTLGLVDELEHAGNPIQQNVGDNSSIKWSA